MEIAGVGKKPKARVPLEPLATPKPWPGLNARLLGLGLGLPTKPIDRLANFSAKEFENFTLEWANGYLKTTIPDIYETQERGGSGDKGRDIVIWRDPPDRVPRRWRLYQCKHYADPLGKDAAAEEIGKILYYTHTGDYPAPEEYWFVTHRGVNGPLQDLLDSPDSLKSFILTNWAQHCEKKICSDPVPLSDALRDHILAFDFSIFRAKQPHDLLLEHSKTPYHLPVFGAPLIERTPPPSPPSTVAPMEARYIQSLFAVIGETIQETVSSSDDFISDEAMSKMFTRSRIAFYCAENLRELSRDQMADVAFFDSLLLEFESGTFYAYMKPHASGFLRLADTVLAAHGLQLGAHPLAPHVTSNDREGMCHQLANQGKLEWCRK